MPSSEPARRGQPKKAPISWRRSLEADIGRVSPILADWLPLPVGPRSLAGSPGQKQGILFHSAPVEVDDIISYHDVVVQEKIALQKGINYGVGKNYSVFLISLREDAPYADAPDPVTGMPTYEGHDEPQRQLGSAGESPGS